MGLHSRETLDGGQSAETEAHERAVDDDSTIVRPTFTPAVREASDAAAPGDTVPDAADSQARTVPEPAESYTDADVVEEPAAESAEPVTATSAAAVTPSVPAAVAPAAVADLDQPLLSMDTELLAQWQQVQVGFINDPHAAVAGAADLVEQAGRALAEALAERQRQMRTMWDHNSADGPVAQRDTNADTERMRQMMQRYQALFNQLYQPV